MISPVLLVASIVTLAFAFEHQPLIHHAPKPYSFGYSVKDHHGEQHREETGDGASGVKGSYGFTDARGVHRQVNYVADHAGFRAQVKTNEPGTANQNPAAVQMISSAPYAGHETRYLAGPGPLAETGFIGASVPVNGIGLGYGGPGYAGLGYGPGYNGYGLQQALLGTLGYARYGY